MKTISTPEFDSLLASLAAEIVTKFPNIHLGGEPQTLWLKTEACTGLVRLKTSPDNDDAQYVDLSFASGSALTGPIRKVETGVRDYFDVLQALHYVETVTLSIRVARELNR